MHCQIGNFFIILLAILDFSLLLPIQLSLFHFCVRNFWRHKTLHYFMCRFCTLVHGFFSVLFSLSLSLFQLSFFYALKRKQKVTIKKRQLQLIRKDLILKMNERQLPTITFNIERSNIESQQFDDRTKIILKFGIHQYHFRQLFIHIYRTVYI